MRITHTHVYSQQHACTQYVSTIGVRNAPIQLFGWDEFLARKCCSAIRKLARRTERGKKQENETFDSIYHPVKTLSFDRFVAQMQNFNKVRVILTKCA